jgi:DNA-binding winged helix-turn-helix (wHTH) protein
MPDTNNLPGGVNGAKAAGEAVAQGAAAAAGQATMRFGTFQLDSSAGQLVKSGRVVRLKPQPLKLLQLLASRPGEVVTREEIRAVLWGSETYVDFDQGVNTAIRQIRDALGEDADHPLYIETVPKRGYRFIGPVESGIDGQPVPYVYRGTDLNLQKALWLNIAELRMQELRRRKLKQQLAVGLAALAAIAAIYIALQFW